MVRCTHRHTKKEHPWCFNARRIGHLDIETSNLVADFGIMLTYCLKVDGKPTIYEHTIQAKDIFKAKAGDEDRHLVAQLVEDLTHFDIITTFYGARFDVPFVRTRAVSMGIPFPHYGDLKHIDVYDRVRRKFRLSSNRLENACRVLLGRTTKTRIDAKYWRGGQRGDAASLKEILDHNRRDVHDLERLYHAVIDFSRPNEPSV